jgi:hypothetical protein
MDFVELHGFARQVYDTKYGTVPRKVRIKFALANGQWKKKLVPSVTIGGTHTVELQSETVLPN